MPLLKFFSKITPTCFHDHKMSSAAPVYKFIKMVHFNVRLVLDKNFRTIAPTVFPVDVSTNWLKFLLIIAHIFLNFTANRTKFYGDVGFR